MDFSSAFIGAGNMASSIIGGLLDAGVDPALLRAADKSTDMLEKLRNRGIEALHADNSTAIEGADVVVLAIKPQVMRSVCEELAPVLGAEQLILSIAAGIGSDSLCDWLGGHAAVVRCMPNTPCLLRAGASGLFATADVSTTQRERAAAIMQAVGMVRWVDDEQQLHAVTAVSGSAPAYFFLFMQAMIEEGIAMGLSEETARGLCVQSCIGAGRMLAEGDLSAAELTRQVCSPGGTTERAVAAFREGQLGSLVSDAMRACAARSREMARELS